MKNYLKRTKSKPKDCSSIGSDLSMGLFFPDYSICCPFVWRDDYHSKPLSFKAPESLCSKFFCKYLHFSTDPKRESPFRQMVKVLSSAQNSVDICLWVFSVPFLANLCLRLSKNNVLVRIIIDSREDETTNSQINYLRESGISVRFGPQMVNSGMFHHKFAIIDSTILMTGSLNWTLSAIRKSCENISITSRQQLVSAYVQRFNYYWNTFSSVPTNKKRSLSQQNPEPI